jgi:hypothetical protein
LSFSRPNSKSAIKQNTKADSDLVFTLSKLKFKIFKSDTMKTQKRFSISSLTFIAAFALLISSLFNLPVVATFLFSFALGCFPMPQGSFLMAVTKEVWCKDIVDNLYKDNAFAMRAFNADIYVLLGKVVHIPVAGAPSAIKKNLTQFPQTAVKRADSEITYAIDNFYSTPAHIENIEQYELEYDKRQSVLGEDESALIQASIDNLVYLWSPSNAYAVELEGAAVPATLAGATGNRSSMTKATFSKIKLKMDKDNIPAVGRIALLTADHYNQFFDSLSDAEKTNFGKVADLEKGIVGQYLGFTIYMRSTVSRYRGANLAACAKVDEQDAAFAAGATDRAASLFYHELSVERAKGEVKMFTGEDRPEYYGSIYSLSMRLGGRIRRVAGVYAAIEALAA